MVKPIIYNDTIYEKRSEKDKMEGFILASIASAAIMGGLKYARKPFRDQLILEHANNHLYKDSFEKALKISGLKNKGVGIIEAQKEVGPISAEAKGLNACYIPSVNKIKLNTDKACITGFHEMGHALNNLSSRIPKYLQKMRAPGYAIAGLMEYFAIFSRNKPKGAKRNVTDVIEDNCGKIAFLALLPTVIEEGIASYKGVKLARKAGVSEKAIKSMKTLYKKAFFTYASRAVLGGLAVGMSRIIMDYFSRPKEIKNSDFSFFM